MYYLCGSIKENEPESTLGLIDSDTACFYLSAVPE